MNREIVDQLNEQFASLIDSLEELVRSVPLDPFHREKVLRSAAAIEQTCGGLTANLWDDPFEWTLPETLSNAERIIEYLSEVDAARERAFSSIADDNALSKFISVPSGEPQRLIDLLRETLAKAGDYLK